MSADTVITSGSSPSPNPAPSPLPIDLTYVLAAASAHAAGALDAKNAAIAAKNSADADASATAADRSATHTDRVAADADALATAADRVQTGLDRAAVNTAKTDTLAAKDLAVSAKDTAVTNAGAAASDRAAVAALLASFRNVLLGAFANDAAAVAFASANGITVSDGLMYENTVADKFRIYTGAAWADYDASAQQQSAAASLSATNAAAAQAAAETARDGAVTAKNAADADAVATAADRVQTGLDRAAVNTAKTDTLTAKDLAVAAKDTAVTNASAAASDRAAVAALLTSFRNVLLGAFANDAAAVAFAAANGITVADGLMYENTVSDKFRIYTGSAWADYDASAQQQNAAAALSATNAASAQAAAETARDGAVTAKNAADADAVATAADRVQTGLDRTATSASAAAAASSATSAAAAKTASESARDLTLGYKSSAEAAAEAAAAAAAAAAAEVSGLSNMAAASKAIITATDATVLADIETGRDTHEWRLKIVNASHQIEALNTSTRGARAQYPSRGKIIGRTTANTLSVIDLDDPTAPLWKAWTVAGITSALYTQGKIFYSGTGGLYEIDLVLDGVWKRDTSGLWVCNNQNVATYNQSTATWTLVSASGAIVSATVNDIAAAVTPLTPLNPLRCGLPNPTVAVATGGGVSVIRADGAVANVTNANGGYTYAYKVILTPISLIMVMDVASGLAGRYPIAIPVPLASRTVSMSGDALVNPEWGGAVPKILIVGSDINNGVQSVAPVLKNVAFGSSLGLSLLMRDTANPANGAVAYATTTYSTGYMAGLTKLALAESSAALANMVGGTASDRSGAGNNPTVTGTITRSVVASGAELAAYGGFGTSNYIELPYAAAFDPGTGDVQVMAEVVLTSAIAKQVTFLDRIAPGGGPSAGAYYRLNTDSSGKPRFIISDGTNVATALAPVALSAGAHCIRGIRRAASSRIELEVDGVIVATASASAVGSLNNASAVLRIGQAVAGGAPMDIAGPGIARVHVSMSAPTPDQIVAWWTAHSPQFASNAKSLIAGSTNVQGLAYDTDTDQLGIATAAGTNVFNGLVRAGMVNVAGVNDNAKLSNDNHKAVAFSGGDLVIVSGAQVYGSLLATSGLREIAKRRASVPPYDPTWGIFNGVTTDATPTIIASTPILEGRAYRFRATVAAVRYGGTATEKAVYDVTGIVTRDIGGNVVVVSTTTTVSEVTSSMDCVAQANTTAQTLEIKATGKASTRLAWGVELEFYDIGLMGAAA